MYREAFVNILNTKLSLHHLLCGVVAYFCFVRLYLNERELEFLVAFYMHFYKLLLL